MFHQLVRFRVENGHCLVPNRYPKDPSLGSWVSTQRRQYKHYMSGDGNKPTSMTIEKIRALESIGFRWVTRDPRHVPWEDRFRELMEYRRVHGNCLVPIGFKENIQLSNWVSTQRQEYKLLKDGRNSRLTHHRIELLNSIDFVWEAHRGGMKKKKSQLGSHRFCDVMPKHHHRQLVSASPPSSDDGKGSNHVDASALHHSVSVSPVVIEPVVHTTTVSNEPLSTSSNRSSTPTDNGGQYDDCEDDKDDYLFHVSSQPRIKQQKKPPLLSSKARNVSGSSNSSTSTHFHSNHTPHSTPLIPQQHSTSNIAPLHSCQDSLTTATTTPNATASASETNKNETHVNTTKPLSQHTDAAVVLSSLANIITGSQNQQRDCTPIHKKQRLF